jgi:hypothetical protein
METLSAEVKAPPATPYVLSLRQLLAQGGGRRVTHFDLGELAVEVRAMHDSLWAIVRRAGQGGLAVRAAFLAGPFEWKVEQAAANEAARITLDSALGEHVVTFATSSDELERLRVTVRFTPATPMLVPFLPRDLYPLDEEDDPLGAEGVVEAGQRGLNAGIVYFRIDRPSFGNVLYFQNLTALNDYYLTTSTKPDGAVGGVWPELGYLPPSPPQSGTPPTDPLEPGKEVTLSDAILVFRHDAPPHERESARQFLQMLGAAYKMLDLPPTEYRDWIVRSERTLSDLDTAPEATIRHYGKRFVHPYTAAEYPDVMVQMSLLSALRDWERWTGQPISLARELKAGVPKFYDAELKTMRRYLPNVGKDKDADAVDSWYLYHPLLNLGNLALDGDEEARALLLDSVDYAIGAAHHFDYRWPIQFKVTDFTVITECAEADGRGQTDVAGVYAWVMLQLYELTEDKRYLDEAEAAIQAAVGLAFNINYQANLTAWGAAACMRLWRITNRKVYLEQSYVYLGSFFHNSVIWQSKLGHAASYETFLAVTCLQDARRRAGQLPDEAMVDRGSGLPPSDDATRVFPARQGGRDADRNATRPGLGRVDCESYLQKRGRSCAVGSGIAGARRRGTWPESQRRHNGHAAVRRRPVSTDDRGTAGRRGSGMALYPARSPARRHRGAESACRARAPVLGLGHAALLP